MTRETKVGIGVSCSFLCLVSVVLYCKMRQTPAAIPAEYAKEDGTVIEIPDDPAPSPTASSDPPLSIAPQKTNPVTTQVPLKPVPTGGIVQTKATGEPPPGQASDLFKSLNGTFPPSSTKDKKADKAAPPSRPDNEPRSQTGGWPAKDDKSAPGTKPPAGSELFPPPMPAPDSQKADTSSPAKPLPKAPDSGWNNILGLGGNNTDKSPPKPNTPLSRPNGLASPPGQADNRLVPAPAPVTPEPRKSNPVFGDKPETLPQPANSPPAQGNRSTLLGDPPPPDAMPDAKSGQIPLPPGKELLNPMPAPTAPPPAPTYAKPTVPEPPPTSGANLLRPVPMPTTNPSGLTGGLAPSRAPSSPPAADDAPDRNVRLGSPATSVPAPGDQYAQATPRPSAPDSRTPPPIGAPPTADSPPILVPVPAGNQNPVNIVPRVESYDEETYVCKANDSFRSISQQYFRTEKYEKALMLFNRNHPRRNEGVQQDPPVLREGQPVFIPPIRVLERQYPTAVPGGGTPAPASPGGGFENRSSGAAPAAGVQYQVRRSDEMMYDIAKRTLGDGNRWQEILRYNPGVDPKYAVPVGTVLRLPPDAKVN